MTSDGWYKSVFDIDENQDEKVFTRTAEVRNPGQRIISSGRQKALKITARQALKEWIVEDGSFLVNGAKGLRVCKRANATIPRAVIDWEHSNGRCVTGTQG